VGPWRNAKGLIIANNIEHLHDDGGLNLLSFDNSLDENGNPVPIGGATGTLVHDILTARPRAARPRAAPATTGHRRAAASPGASVTRTATGRARPDLVELGPRHHGLQRDGWRQYPRRWRRGSIYCFEAN